jgi:hypothetical protein
MQEIATETREALRVTVTVDGRRPAQRRELTRRDYEQLSNTTSAARSSPNTQCFICSRIYFDQSLQRCPHCNSESLQHYTTDDLNHFARDPLRKPFGADAWIEEAASTAIDQSAD